MKDFRPISLISSLYKIISKILASRIKIPLGKVISKVQTTFLPDRQLLDGVVLVVNEIIDLVKRNKEECMVVKIDFKRRTIL